MKKVTKSLYFKYAWGRPYPTDCNGSLHIGSGHQRNQSCKFLWLSVNGFGFCEGSNIGFFHRKLTCPLQHCLSLLRWHVIHFCFQDDRASGCMSPTQSIACVWMRPFFPTHMQPGSATRHMSRSAWVALKLFNDDFTSKSL
jgi:hypothetical protein